MEDLGIIASESLTQSEKTKNCFFFSRDIKYTINFPNKSYKNQDLNQEKLFSLINELKKIPTTSQPSYQSIYNTLKEKTKLFKQIVLIVPSRELSGTYQGCVSAINDIEKEIGKNKIFIIEAPSIALCETIIAEKIIDLHRQDMPIEKIVNQLKSSTSITYAFPSDLEFLKISGRVNEASAIAINILKIRPVICMKPYQKPAVVKKIRGFKALLKYINSTILEEKELIKIEKVLITPILLDKEEHNLLKKVLTKKNILFEEVEPAPPIVATHFGPNSFGLLISYK